MLGHAPRKFACLLGALLCACASAQQPEPATLIHTGQIVAGSHATPYLIRHLPVSSFPDLPAPLALLLNRRGCLIPQSYEAHHPENVIHASLERAGSTDWALLCSVQGRVSLLVYFSSAPTEVQELATAPETERLQAHDASGVLGFNWAIDPATPEQIRTMQIGLPHRPPLADHDALADSVVEGRAVYRFYTKNAWTVLEMPE